MTTDNLRDRIAVLLAEVANGRALYQMTNADATVMADAVIAELGLKSQWINDGIISDGPPPNWWLPCDIRYTTEWERSE